MFLGDDGFGCEVARVLAQMSLPAEIKVVDYGIRGLDLAYSLLEPYRTVILVDAIARGSRPGTIYLLQPAGSAGSPHQQTTLDPHYMDPAHLLAMARSLGDIPAEIYIVGCEPADFGDELEGRMGLSEIVAASVHEAVRTVLQMIDSIHQSKAPAAGPAYAIHQSS
jgi:hydrogenase maturation protease